MTGSNNFICYDGENKGNKYFLLGNSIEYIYNKEGLSSRKCFEFLTRKQKKKRIIFNLHYDLQFWIKDFKDEKILSLMKGERVSYYNFELQYFQKKMLIIKKGHSLFKIYDILSFFNQSLLNTIERLEIKLNEGEKKILLKGKKDRVNFDNMSLEEIFLYNKTECIVTEKIAGKIYSLMLESFYRDKKGRLKNLVITNFFGASAIASKLLKDYEVSKLKPFEKFSDIFESSYYGGRFEVLKLGSFKNVYKYDINSAYPSILKDLTEIKDFKKVKNPKKINDKGIYLIYYKQFFPNDFICPFPLRHKTGRIFYTGEIQGYYFGCEINAFLNSGINPENYELKIFSGIVPVEGNKIFENKEGYNLIDDMFEQRNYFKQRKDLKHYIYKIALNSLYGKFAQKVGSKSFTHFYYASYITAKVRSILIEQSYKIDYKKIICYATDCIISEIPLKVKVGKELGEWEYDFIEEAEILMSGFYRLQKENKKYYFGLRGFNVKEKQFEKILFEVKKKGFSFIKVNQFISHKLAIKQYKAFKEKRLLFTPIKKIVDIKRGNFKREYFYSDLINSKKSHFHNFEQIESEKMKNLEINQEGFFIDY
jgi:hypothetical protein